MQVNQTRDDILQALRRVQRLVAAHAAAVQAVRAGLWLMPVAALLIAIDNRWLTGMLAWPLLAVGGVACAGWAARAAWRARRAPLAAALLLDDRAGFKSRVSSALEFLEADSVEGPRAVQVRDAVAHLHALDWEHHFALHWPRPARWLPLAAVLLLAALWVPPVQPPPDDGEASVDAAAQAAQLEELIAAREALADIAAEDPLAQEMETALQEIEEEFAEGTMDEREVMIALSRLETSLAARMPPGDMEALARETQLMAPALESSETMQQAAMAMRENQSTEAANALRKVAVAEETLDQEQRKQAREAMKMAAARLRESGAGDGKPPAGDRSFAQDLEEGAEGLEQSDSDAFDQAMQRMAGKLNQIQQYQNMEAMRQQMGEAKAAMAQAGDSGKSGTEGAPASEGDESGEGGLLAGSGADEYSTGEPDRLEDSVRQLIAARNQLGQGPTQSRTESIEGQLSDSTLAVRDIHAEYAAAAEAAIERESVPLSHRQHVKRYFEAIRPPAE